MNTEEFLLTSSTSTQHWSACLWDYNSLNARQIYRNGGTMASKTLVMVGNDYILSAESNKPLLHVWPLNSQEQAKNIRLILPEPASCLDITPSNTYLAVGIGLKLYIWQTCSGKLFAVQQKNFQPITCVKFSCDGEFLVVAGQDGMLVTYLLGDLVQVKNNYLSQSDIGQVEPIYTKDDHSMPIRDIHVGIFNKKARLATVSSDQTCRIYKLSNGEQLLTLVFNEPLTCVIFDAPCWQLYVGTNSGVIRHFHLRNPPRTLEHHVTDSNNSFMGHKMKISCLALNYTNTVLASGSEDNFVFTWDIFSKQILKKIEHKGAVTNIKFILNHENFTVQNLKPRMILRNLERVLDLDSKTLCGFYQDFEIELSDEEDSLREEKLSQLSAQNRRLRVSNKQLYDAALEFSKRYHK